MRYRLCYEGAQGSSLGRSSGDLFTVDQRRKIYSIQDRGWARIRFIPIGISPRLAFVGQADTVTVLVTVTVACTVVGAFDALEEILLELVILLVVDDAFIELEITALVVEMDVAAFEVDEAALLDEVPAFNVEVAAFDIEETAFEVDVTAFDDEEAALDVDTEVDALLVVVDVDVAAFELEIEVDALAVTKISF